MMIQCIPLFGKYVCTHAIHTSLQREEKGVYNKQVDSINYAYYMHVK